MVLPKPFPMSEPLLLQCGEGEQHTGQPRYTLRLLSRILRLYLRLLRLHQRLDYQGDSVLRYRITIYSPDSA